MTREELTEKMKGLPNPPCRTNLIQQVWEIMNAEIEELDKENGKLEGKLADLQSEYIELENLHNNIVNELKEQLTKAKEIIQDMLRDIPNRMWYTDATIKEAEQFLKEDK